MNEASLKRLMNLARKTGDVLIVTDPDGQEPIVLMNIDRYETLREDEIGRVDEEDWSPAEPMMDWDRTGEANLASVADVSESDLEEEFEERIGPTATEPVITPIEPVEEVVVKNVESEAEKPQKLAENGEEKFYLESID